MMGLTYEQIVEKIRAHASLTDFEIEKKVKEKLDKLSYLISKEGAAHIVANELGVKVFEAPKGGRLKVKELQPQQRNIDLLAKVVKFYGIRSFKTEKKEGRNASFLVGDETGKVRVTVWDETLLPTVEKIKEEGIILIKNAYIRENNGFKEVHLGSGSQLILDPPGETVGEVGAARMEAARRAIADLQEKELATVTGTVVQVFEPRFYEACGVCGKKVSIEDGRCREHGLVEKKLSPVVNIILDDGTDNIRVVFFRDQAEAVLGTPMAELAKVRDNPLAFEEIRDKVLAKQVQITGRVTRNEMFDRLEMVANSVEEAKPEVAAGVSEEKIA